MKESTEKQLAFIILDIVAIIAILGVVLLADLSDQQEKNAFQKLILGNAITPLEAHCGLINCGGSQAARIGTTAGQAVCQCPDGNTYAVSKISE